MGGKSRFYQARRETGLCSGQDTGLRVWGPWFQSIFSFFKLKRRLSIRFHPVSGFLFSQVGKERSGGVTSTNDLKVGNTMRRVDQVWDKREHGGLRQGHLRHWETNLDVLDKVHVSTQPLDLLSEPIE